MRALTIALCLLATPALSFVAGCTSSAMTPEATCLAHNVAPGTWAYANCVEMVREKGALTDISQITPDFRQIVPPFHRQGNRIPSAAIRWHDF